MYTFNMLVQKLSWITLLLLLCQHGVEGRKALACEGGTANLQCSKGYINVYKANYGRADKITCSKGKPKSQISNDQCFQETSIQAVSLRCDGTTSCSVPVQNSVFSDPCIGTVKYLDVTYDCLPIKGIAICEHKQAYIKCDTGVIRIHHANYGRRDKTTCRFPSSNTDECLFPQTTRLQFRCDKKKSCSLNASNSVFGDPCRGVNKYLEVTYSCEKNFGIKAVNLITCEGETAKPTCAQGTIKVLSANYGRTDSKTCSSGRPAGQISNAKCTQNTTLSVLTTQCDGKQNCFIVVGNTAFTDPCPGTYKYLNVSYECILPPPPPPPPPTVPSKNQVTCESNTTHLSCDHGTIKVLSANYGRTDSKTCSSGRPAGQISNAKCTQNTTLSVLTTQCDGKQNCSVAVGNMAFTDPCPGTYKYLNVSYECIMPPPPSAPPKDLLSCESETAHLSCAQGTIKVLSGNYGRIDNTTCSSGKPAGQLSNTKCIQRKSLSVLANRCDGKRHCSVSAINMVFGDPCKGTYKYLNVSYTCVLTTSIICQNKSSHIHCERGRRINIHYANYGRSDTVTCTHHLVGAVSTCFSDQTSTLQHRCNGKTLCHVHASNSEFTDRCPQVHKYLEVLYSCD
nr:uncharacterized protein LOC129430375 [Misgurnus anguillicaudatus]